MDQFVYSITIPSTGTAGLYKELSTSYYKAFTKILLNGDNIVINQFIDDMITKLTHSGPSVTSLTAYDKLYIMLVIRAYNISPTIHFGCKTKEKEKDKDKQSTININVEVNEVISKLTELKFNWFFTVKNSPAGLQIKGSLPTALYIDNISWLLASCINEIIINDKSVYMHELTTDEQIQILDKLPSTVFSEIMLFLKEQNDILIKNPIFEIKTDKEIVGAKEINLSFFDASMFEFLKLMYNCNLKEFYQSEYQLCKAKLPLDLVQNSTPAEVTLYYNIIADDMKKQQKDMEKSQKGGMQLPGGPMGGM